MGRIIHQQIIEAIQELPSKSLPELASFIEYLRFKNASIPLARSPGSSFLLGIAGLGSTVESDLAERDEEISCPKRSSHCMVGALALPTWTKRGSHHFCRDPILAIPGIKSDLRGG
jgi:hypothetical protein